MGKTWSRGTNSRLPFDVNVNLNLSIIFIQWHILRLGRLWSYKSFYFSQEAKGIKIHRKLMTSILKTFHHFNRSSADIINIAQDRMTFGVWPEIGHTL